MGDNNTKNLKQDENIIDSTLESDSKESFKNKRSSKKRIPVEALPGVLDSHTAKLLKRISDFDISYKKKDENFTEKFNKINEKYKDNLEDANEDLNSYIKKKKDTYNKDLQKLQIKCSNIKEKFNKKKELDSSKTSISERMLVKEFSNQLLLNEKEIKKNQKSIKTEEKTYTVKSDLADDLRTKIKQQTQNAIESYDHEITLLNIAHHEKKITSAYSEKFYENTKRNHLAKLDYINQDYSKVIISSNENLQKLNKSLVNGEKKIREEYQKKIELAENKFQTFLDENNTKQAEVMEEYRKKHENIYSKGNLMDDLREKLEQDKEEELYELKQNRICEQEIHDKTIRFYSQQMQSAILFQNKNIQLQMVREEEKSESARNKKDYLTQCENQNYESLIDNFEKEEAIKKQTFEDEYIKKKEQLELNRFIALKEKEMYDVLSLCNVSIFENLKSLNTELYNLEIEKLKSQNEYNTKKHSYEIDNAHLKEKIILDLTDLQEKKDTNDQMYETRCLDFNLKYDQINLDYQSALKNHKSLRERNDSIHNLFSQQIKSLLDSLQKKYSIVLESMKSDIDLLENTQVDLISYGDTGTNTYSCYQRFFEKNFNILVSLLQEFQVQRNQLCEDKANQLTKEKYEDLIQKRENRYQESFHLHQTNISSLRKENQEFSERIEADKKKCHILEQEIYTAKQEYFKARSKKKYNAFKKNTSHELAKSYIDSYKQIVNSKLKEFNSLKEEIEHCKKMIDSNKKEILHKEHALKKAKRTYDITGKKNDREKRKEELIYLGNNSSINVYTTNSIKQLNQVKSKILFYFQRKEHYYALHPNLVLDEIYNDTKKCLKIVEKAEIIMKNYCLNCEKKSNLIINKGHIFAANLFHMQNSYTIKEKENKNNTITSEKEKELRKRKEFYRTYNKNHRSLESELRKIHHKEFEESGYITSRAYKKQWNDIYTKHMLRNQSIETNKEITKKSFNIQIENAKNEFTNRQNQYISNLESLKNKKVYYPDFVYLKNQYQLKQDNLIKQNQQKEALMNLELDEISSEIKRNEIQFEKDIYDISRNTNMRINTHHSIFYKKNISFKERKRINKKEK